jgi:hypothetical protein
MKCAHSEQDIALFVEGDLGPAALHAIEGHLAECPDCRALAEELRTSQATFKDLRQEVVNPASVLDLRRRVLVELDELDSKTEWGRKIERWLFLGARRGYAAAGVAFVLAVCVSASIVWRFSLNRPLPPSATTSLTTVQEKPADRPQPYPEAEAAEAAEQVPARTAVVKRTNTFVPATGAESRRSRIGGVVTATQAPAGDSKEVVVKLLTDDPNIVIYWLVDQNGGSL